MAKGIGKKKVKEIQERFSINKLDRSLALKEGFKSLGDYKSHLWSILLQEKRKDKEDIKKEIKQFYKSVKKLPTPARRDVEQRKQTFEKKIKATRLIQNAFRKFQERKMKPIYKYSISEKKHTKIYSFENTNRTYRFYPPEDIRLFILGNINVITNALKQSLGTSSGIKSRITTILWTVKADQLFAEFKKLGIDMSDFKNGALNDVRINKIINDLKQPYYTSNANYEMLYKSSNLKDFITQQAHINQEEFETFTTNGSNLILVDIEKVNLHIVKNVNPLSASSYMEIPEFIRNKKCCINIKNEDQKCAMWSIKCFKYHHLVPSHKERISHYQTINDPTDYSMLNFPTTICGWDKYEKVNDEQVIIFGVKEIKDNPDKIKTSTIYPLRVSKYISKKGVVIRLLLVEGNGNNHYVPIINFERLMHNEGLSKHHGKMFYCDRCLQHFYTDKKLKEHIQMCQNQEPCKAVFHCRKGLDGDDERIEFKHYKFTQWLPYIAFADGEAFTETVAGCTNAPNKSYTEEYQRHKASGMKYIIVDADGNIIIQKMFDGENTVTKFIKSLDWESKILKEKIKGNIPIRELTEEENKNFETCTHCSICKYKFLDGDKRVHDHDHSSGEYRGVAHNSCNLNYNLKNFKIPVFFHNFAKYDMKYILKEFKDDKKYHIKPIAQNSETYMCLEINNFVFKDSFKFLTASLDKLVTTMNKDDFKILKSQFPDKYELLIRKGVYPYDYVDCEEKLKETQLPSKCKFYSQLTGENISDDDYTYAQTIWKTFKCETMKDYHDLYLNCDVYQLADIFMKFRRVMYSDFGLDPAWYITLPSFAWDCCLKLTGVSLDYITDPNMHLFFEEAMRGGITRITHRYAKANNKYLHDYNPEAISTFISYLDANNLYGLAMSMKQGTGELKWESSISFFTEENILNYDFEKSERCYCLEVDLEYPKELHDLHSDYPLAVERKTIQKSELSPYCEYLSNELINNGLSSTSSEKLVGTLNDKDRYKIHIKHLQLCLQLGMKLKKVHRVLSYKHSAWIKPYIDFNTSKRAVAKSKFEQDLFKLMNNAVFGKTMENVRKRVEYTLCFNDDKKVHKLKGRFNMKNITEFTDHLVGVQMSKTSVTLDKPIYVGFGILELSKVHMYDFHYNVMYKMYKPENVKLLFTDTDSLCYLIKTDDVYEDMKQNSIHFDMSEYPQHHQCYNTTNKKVIGKFKDETNGDPIREFVGLKSKMYGLTTEHSNIEKKVAKGVKKATINKCLHFDTYKSVLNGTNGYFTRHEMNMIRSKEHQLSTVRINKVSLSAFDDKVYILDDGISTLAYGHYRICDK